MPHEDDIATILQADTPLMDILVGGIYTSGELGPLGVTRNTAKDAFGTDGYLLPCALVKGRASVATSEVTDYDAQQQSARQIVEVWLYQEQDSYAAIDVAAARIRNLLFGRNLAGSFELRLAQTWNRLHDNGSLKGASAARQDWQIDYVQ